MRFGGKAALDGIDFQALPGEHWAVTGHNGAGKSTLLRLLRGELRPFLDPERPAHLPPPVSWSFEGQADPSPLAVRPYASILSSELQRHYVRQGWLLTGEEVILSGLGDGFILYSPPTDGEREAVYELAKKLGADHLLAARAPNLSQGQLRLLLLARALIKKPRLLLLDEPTDGLDKVTRQTLFDAVDEAAAEGAGVICAIHRGEDLPGCVNRLLELENGRIVRREALVDRAAQLPRHPVRDLDLPPVRRKPPEQNLPVFTLTGADVYLERKKILHGINWRVNPGEQWILSGPNGSGKSTLLRVIMGEEHVALGGSLEWFGGTQKPTLEERQRFTGAVSDWLRNRYLYDLTGEELIVSGLRGSIGLYRGSTPEEKKEADFWLEQLGLADMRNTRLEQMSEGTARRFLLARALAPRPSLLILDEPCSGLDASSRAQILSAIPTAMQAGVQVLFVSHSPADLAAVEHLFTHELHLEGGRIIRSGPIDNKSSD